MLVMKMPSTVEPRWIMPVILAREEAEIRRVTVESQPGQTVLENPYQNSQHKKHG
jgi:hypothetical protein